MSCEKNKDNVTVNKNMGFVVGHSDLSYLPCNAPLDMDEPIAYLQVVDVVLASGSPNYKVARTPLPSAFNWDYIQQHIQGYHEKVVFDYIKFGFPLSVLPGTPIKSNTQDNHAYPDKVSQFLHEELSHNALFGPLMSRPNGTGHRIILDLSHGDFVVSKVTDREKFDGREFSLKLPSLDHLLPELEKWGPDTRLFKLYISRPFRNVRIDPVDAIHLGIRW